MGKCATLVERLALSLDYVFEVSHISLRKYSVTTSFMPIFVITIHPNFCLLWISNPQLSSWPIRLGASPRVFTGLTKPNPYDRFILVMGMTGSGKSTFISRCTGKDVIVGHGLYSCKWSLSHISQLIIITLPGTDSIDVFDFDLNGRRIYLIDTPGFNDTDRSDIDTLSILASYLGASYANGVRIHGIIMLHPITGNRMSGSSLRNIEMMKAMCGFEFYDNVAIATTMWPDTTLYEDTGTLENREAELMSDQRYFGALISRGATVIRHNEKGIKKSTDEIDSARNIVSHLIQHSEKHVPEVLQLQREITEQRKTLGETGAGIAVARDIHRAKREHEELRRIEADMKRELAKTNSAYAANLQELKEDIEKQLRKSDQEKQALRNSMQDCITERKGYGKRGSSRWTNNFGNRLRLKKKSYAIWSRLSMKSAGMWLNRLNLPGEKARCSRGK